MGRHRKPTARDRIRLRMVDRIRLRMVKFRRRRILWIHGK